MNTFSPSPWFPKLQAWCYMHPVSDEQQKPRQFIILDISEEPRKQGYERWSIIYYDRYLKDEIWRVQRIERHADHIIVTVFCDSLSSQESFRIYPVTRAALLVALPNHATEWERKAIEQKPDIIEEDLFYNCEKKITFQRRLDAITLREKHDFTPTQAMADRFDKILSSYLPDQKLTLELLCKEPWGCYSVKSWNIHYTLAFHKGETCLCHYIGNRFTNSSSGYITEQGENVTFNYYWRGKFPVFNSWPGKILHIENLQQLPLSAML